MNALSLISTTLLVFQGTAAGANAAPPACSAPDPTSTTLIDDGGGAVWITSLRTAVTMDTDCLRSHRVSLRNVRVQAVDPRGFWIGIEGRRLFVSPAEGPLIQVRSGELIDLQGEIRLKRTSRAVAGSESQPYVYAYIVREAPEPVALEPAAPAPPAAASP